MITFEKVSLKEYIWARMPSSDMDSETCKILTQQYTKEWENIKLPRRATMKSAGYDFYAPFDIKINSPKIDIMWGTDAIERRDWVTIPTGIRFVADYDKVFLMCLPRSGLGFKNITRLANTCGVIDSDYYYGQNEGHIYVKMTADMSTTICAGSGMMQGIIVPYLTTDGDNTTERRTGGFGSTDNTSECETADKN